MERKRKGYLLRKSASFDQKPPKEPRVPCPCNNGGTTSRTYDLQTQTVTFGEEPPSKQHKRFSASSILKKFSSTSSETVEDPKTQQQKPFEMDPDLEFYPVDDHPSPSTFTAWDAFLSGNQAFFREPASCYMDVIPEEDMEQLLESDTDDTGSSVSTVVDRFSSRNSTANSSFSERCKGASSIDVAHFDLEKVLSPFERLEMELDSHQGSRDEKKEIQRGPIVVITNSSSCEDVHSEGEDPPKTNGQVPSDIEESANIDIDVDQTKSLSENTPSKSNDTNQIKSSILPPVPSRSKLVNGCKSPAKKTKVDTAIPILPPPSNPKRKKSYPTPNIPPRMSPHLQARRTRSDPGTPDQPSRIPRPISTASRSPKSSVKSSKSSKLGLSKRATKTEVPEANLKNQPDLPEVILKDQPETSLKSTEIFSSDDSKTKDTNPDIPEISLQEFCIANGLDSKEDLVGSLLEESDSCWKSVPDGTDSNPFRTNKTNPFRSEEGDKANPFTKGNNPFEDVEMTPALQPKGQMSVIAPPIPERPSLMKREKSAEVSHSPETTITVSPPPVINMCLQQDEIEHVLASVLSNNIRLVSEPPSEVTSAGEQSQLNIENKSSGPTTWPNAADFQPAFENMTFGSTFQTVGTSEAQITVDANTFKTSFEPDVLDKYQCLKSMNEVKSSPTKRKSEEVKSLEETFCPSVSGQPESIAEVNSFWPAVSENRINDVGEKTEDKFAFEKSQVDALFDGIEDRIFQQEQCLSEDKTCQKQHSPIEDKLCQKQQQSLIEDMTLQQHRPIEDILQALDQLVSAAPREVEISIDWGARGPVNIREKDLSVTSGDGSDETDGLTEDRKRCIETLLKEVDECLRIQKVGEDSAIVIDEEEERTPLCPGTPDVPTAGYTAPSSLPDHHDPDNDILSEHSSPEMLRQDVGPTFTSVYPQDPKHHSPGCDDSGVFLEEPLASSPETQSRSAINRLHNITTSPPPQMRHYSIPAEGLDSDDLGLASSSIDSADDLDGDPLPSSLQICPPVVPTRQKPPPVPARKSLPQKRFSGEVTTIDVPKQRKTPLSKSSSSGEDSNFGEGDSFSQEDHLMCQSEDSRNILNQQKNENQLMYHEDVARNILNHQKNGGHLMCHDENTRNILNQQKNEQSRFAMTRSFHEDTLLGLQRDSQESKTNFLARTLSSSSPTKKLEVPSGNDGSSSMRIGDNSSSAFKWKSEECLRTAAESKWSLSGRRFEKAVSVKDRIAMFSEMEANQSTVKSRDLQRYGSENNIKAVTITAVESKKVDLSSIDCDGKQQNCLLQDSKWQSLHNISKKSPEKETIYSMNSNMKTALSIPSLSSNSSMENLSNNGYVPFPIKLEVEPLKPIVSTYPETQLTTNKRYNYGLYSLKNLKNTEDLLSKKASNLLSIIDTRKQQPLRKLKGLVIPEKPPQHDSNKTLPTIVSSDSDGGGAGNAKDCRRASLPITVVTAGKTTSLPRNNIEYQKQLSEPPWKTERGNTLPKYSPAFKKRSLELPGSSLSPTPPSSLTSPLSPPPSSPSSICSSNASSTLQQNVFQFSLSHSKPVQPLLPEKALMSPTPSLQPSDVEYEGDNSEDSSHSAASPMRSAARGPKDTKSASPSVGPGIIQSNTFTSSTKPVVLQPLLVETLVKTNSVTPRAAVCISKTEINLRMEGQNSAPSRPKKPTDTLYIQDYSTSRTNESSLSSRDFSTIKPNESCLSSNIRREYSTIRTKESAVLPSTGRDYSKTRTHESSTLLTNDKDYSTTRTNESPKAGRNYSKSRTHESSALPNNDSYLSSTRTNMSSASFGTESQYSMTKVNTEYANGVVHKTTSEQRNGSYQTSDRAFTNGNLSNQNGHQTSGVQDFLSRPEVPLEVPVGKFRACPLKLQETKALHSDESEDDDDSHSTLSHRTEDSRHTTTDECLSDATTDSFEKPRLVPQETLRATEDYASTEGYLSDASTDVSLRRFTHRPLDGSTEEYLSDATAESPDPDWMSGRGQPSDSRYRSQVVPSVDGSLDLRPKRLSQQRTVLRASVEPSGSVQKFKALAEKWEQRADVISPPPPLPPAVAAPQKRDHPRTSTVAPGLFANNTNTVIKGKGSNLPPSLMPRNASERKPLQRSSPIRTSPTENQEIISPETNGWTHHYEEVPARRESTSSSGSSKTTLKEEELAQLLQDTVDSVTPEQAALNNGIKTTSARQTEMWNNEPRNRRGADFSRSEWSSSRSTPKASVSDIRRSFENGNGEQEKPILPKKTTTPDRTPVISPVVVPRRAASVPEDDETRQLLEEAMSQLHQEGVGGQFTVLSVLLRREGMDGGSVGITLAGGADYEVKEITVHKVIGGSIADRDGRVQKGDRVMSINGRDVRGVSHGEALHILKAPNPRVLLVLARNTNLHRPNVGSPTEQKRQASHCQQNAEMFLVELHKDATGVGFSIEGGKDSPQGDRALLIKRLFKGSAADKEGRLEEGDEILTVNNHPVTNMTRTEAWNFLKKLPEGPVRLHIRKANLLS